MLIFKTRKKLNDEIRQLKIELDLAQCKYDKVLSDLGKSKQEVTALRNVIHRQDELLAKNKQRIKTQQDIIEKQNTKLGVKKNRKVEDKEHDPFIEE